MLVHNYVHFGKGPPLGRRKKVAEVGRSYSLLFIL
jgi:hypothetical protein